MPQKLNPDSAELLRAKSPRVAASYATLLGVMHALPLTYGKDMQEDKEPLFDAIDTVEALPRRDRRDAGRDRASTASGMEDASGDEMLAATEVADLLVRRGVPFREAHGIVGGLVRDAVEQRQVALRADPGGAARSAPSTSTTPTTRCCSAAAGWSRSGSPAAPARCRWRRQIEAARETLAAVRARVVEERVNRAEPAAGAAARSG